MDNCPDCGEPLACRRGIIVLTATRYCQHCNWCEVADGDRQNNPVQDYCARHSNTMGDQMSLRDKVAEAIFLGKQTLEHNQKLAVLRSSEQQIQDERLAKEILDSLPDKCLIAAAQGKDRVDVMKIDNPRVLEVSQLDGVARIVWQGLSQGELNPVLQYWYVDDGRECGNVIYIPI